MTISIEDYKHADGRTDWDRYKAAQKAAGEVCSRCGSWLVTLAAFRGGATGPQTCAACRGLKRDQGEVDHDSLLRCPGCEHSFAPEEVEAFHVYVLDESEPEVQCPRCDRAFDVRVRTRFTFTSPEVDGRRGDQPEPCPDCGGSGYDESTVSHHVPAPCGGCMGGATREAHERRRQGSGE